MSVEDTLMERSGSACELCGQTDALAPFAVPPASDDTADQSVLVCGTCRGKLGQPSAADGDHWRCLSDSMWSQVPAVQVVVWRLLTSWSSESWAQELLDMLYVEDDVRSWAESHVEEAEIQGGEGLVHRDGNGAVLSSGDTVTLIKDLTVKGAGFTAKRGTAVRGIALVHDNADHIEGRIQGQRIVILTAFVKKQG